MTFVDENEIADKYFEKPYYLVPDKEADKVYALLREAMKESGKAGVARFVLRNREHMALLKPDGEALTLIQMRFASEIRPEDGLNLPAAEGYSSKELNMAVKLIDRLSEPWEPEQFHDTYTEDLQRLIQEKIEGVEVRPVEEEPNPEQVTDLFARLAESLEKVDREKSQPGKGNGHGRKPVKKEKERK